jgi:outer membrane protein OmpA-like peptidoglycan-associated protein/subtilisin family serine protease
VDPALQELLASGEASDEVEIVVRLRESAEPPPILRLVSRFGPIATARIERSAIWQIYGDPAIASIKAPREMVGEDDFGPLISVEEAEYIDVEPSDLRRPPALAQTGRGSVIGVIDWGCDVAHPDFISADGRTRLLALWDQRSPRSDLNPYGYGQVLRQAAIDDALGSDDPYRRLRYHPAQSDSGIGAHGTHVLGIAAGNGRGGGPLGIAPEAELIFVQLGRPGWDRAGPLGDSSHLLDALHFIVSEAGQRPLVINMSIGRHAGPHDGSTLVEQAIDWLVRARPGTAVVQSTGNYYARDVHCSGRLWNGAVDELAFEVHSGNSTPNELEVWYPGRDVFSATLLGPDGRHLATVPLGGKATIEIDGARVGNLYHRARDPNNGDHHINLFQYTNAPSGVWRLQLTGKDVSDGRYHAWIERDPGCSRCQALFDSGQVDRRHTTGSICNGLQTIAVGAYDAHHPSTPLARFSSSGPTRDGRLRPLLLAPGVRVLSARSRPRSGEGPPLTRMSGTSMAAPHVTGTIALMLEAAGRIDIVQIRRALFDSLGPCPGDRPEDRHRAGLGVLDVAAAVQRAIEISQQPAAAGASGTAATAAEFGDTGNDRREAGEPVLAESAADPLEPFGQPSDDRPPLPFASQAIADAAPTPPTATPAALPSPLAVPAEETVMNAEADCCGEACLNCEHCAGQPCATCPCCHAEVAEASTEQQAVIQVVPSPLDPLREAPIEAGDNSEPLIQVVPSPLAGGGDPESQWQVDESDEVLTEFAEAEQASEFVEQHSGFEHDEHEEYAPHPAYQAQEQEQDWDEAPAEHAWSQDEDESAWPHPVEAAEALVAAGIDDATEFVAESLQAAGEHWPPGCTVRSLFDDLTGRSTVPQRLRMEHRFELVGRPGRPLSLALQAGDLLIRRGDNGFASAAFIAHPWLYREHEARAHGLLLESSWPGLYAHVVEPGARPQQGQARLARRVCRSDGGVLPNILIVRPRPPAEYEHSDAEFGFDALEATPDANVRWLQQTLNRAINAGLVVDGLRGPATNAAVRRYQQARGLTVDGIVGPQTLQALRSEYGGGTQTPPAYQPPPPPAYEPPPPAYQPPPPPPAYEPPPPPPAYEPPPPAYQPPPPPPAYDRPPTPPQPPRQPPRQPPAYRRPPAPPRPPRPPAPAYPPRPPVYQRPPPARPPARPPTSPPARPPGYRRPPTPAHRRPPSPSYPPPTPSYRACRRLDRFGYDSAQLNYAHRSALDEAAQQIVASGSRSVILTGYASPEGSAAYNLALGQRRAEAAAAELRQAIERLRAGAAAQIRIDVRSEGETRQISGDAAANRRVEICYEEARPTPTRPPPTPPRPRPPRPPSQTRPTTPRPPVQPRPTTPRPPPGPPQTQVLTRFDTSSTQGQAMLLRYEEAVRRMQALPDDDPRSWTFQWYTHAVRSDRNRAGELARVFSGNTPARQLAERMWNTCRAHFDAADVLFFLPWHRMYVYFFERICRRLLGDDSFTLPYWNYSSGSSVLPARFREPSSPLFRAERNPGPNQGRPIDQGQAPGAVSAARALARLNYDTRGNNEGFNEFLDSDPHGPVHVMIGDRNRGMGTIAWAARDPIFWLHHCNIDRIWASWNAAGRRNPSDAAFLDRRFTFADENGQAVTARVGDFVDIQARRYRYERLESVPTPSAAEAEPESDRPDHPDHPTQTRRRAMARRSTVAPAGGIPLGGNAIRVNLGRPTRDSEEFDESGQGSGRTYLVMRNIRADAQPGVVYHVYLSLPAGAAGQAAQQHYVGPLSFFDAVPMPDHGGHFIGKTRRFDVTAITRRLRAAGQLGDEPSVTIAPAGQPPSAAQPVIGEISFVEE